MSPTPPTYQSKRSTRLRPLSQLTERLVGPGLQKRSRFLAKLIGDWSDIAGEAASYCLPVDLQFPNNKRIDGTVVLSVVSGRGPKVQMMSQTLITQMNRSFGFAAVSRIRLRQDMVRASITEYDKSAHETGHEQDTVPLHTLEKVTSQIQSPELRAALIRLGRNIK